jgi:hypothetical protein
LVAGLYDIILVALAQTQTAISSKPSPFISSETQFKLYHQLHHPFPFHQSKSGTILFPVFPSRMVKNRLTGTVGVDQQYDQASSKTPSQFISPTYQNL